MASGPMAQSDFALVEAVKRLGNGAVGPTYNPTDWWSGPGLDDRNIFVTADAMIQYEVPLDL